MATKMSKSEAERYRSSKMEGSTKVGSDRLKKVSEKPSKMKGGAESTGGAMKGRMKSK